MISSTLLQSVNEGKLLRKPTVRVSVEMNPSTLMEQEALEIERDLERLAPYSGYQPVVDLESADILKYLKTLSWMRCQHVQIKNDKAYQPYKSLYYNLYIPVLPYQLFIAMGRAYDESFAIEFIPEYPIDSVSLLSPEEMIAISDLLRSMVQIGFAAVRGLPKDRDGELAFMALSHVENTVTGYRDDHPAYGFLASFFTQQQLNEVTGSMSRMIYGYDVDYRIEIGAIHSSMTHSFPKEKPDVS